MDCKVPVSMWRHDMITLTTYRETIARVYRYTGQFLSKAYLGAGNRKVPYVQSSST